VSLDRFAKQIHGIAALEERKQATVTIVAVAAPDVTGRQSARFTWL
jgi:hypothetical protein